MRRCIFGALYLVVFSLLLPCALAQYGQTVQYFPQAVAGGGAVTVFSLHNPGTTNARVAVELLDPDGLEFYSSEVNIAGGGVHTLSVGVPEDPMRIGWARLTAVFGRFEATEFFQLSLGSQALPRVGVLPCSPSSNMKFFAYLAHGLTNTGIAVANTSETQTATITLRRYNTMGALTGTATTTLQPRKQLARFLDEEPWFKGLQDFEGIVELESNRPVVLVMLRSDNSLLASAAVLNPNLQYLTTGSITTNFIADGAVTTDKIANGTITSSDLGDDSVTPDKLSASNQGTAGQVLGTDGSRFRWQTDSLTLPFKFQGSWPSPDGVTPGIFLKTDQPLALVIDVPSSNTDMTGAAVSIGVNEPANFPALVVSNHLHVAVEGYSEHNIGVAGTSRDSYGVDAYGQNKAGIRSHSPNGDGLMAYSEAGFKSGVYAVNSHPDGYAAFFGGRVGVTGELTKGSGAFKIDHPLDPERKYLYHSFVESPDMKNVYDGLATLDSFGEAWVELPDWFEALNRDFRYQLTSVGVQSPGLFVAQRIEHNRFKIAGGTPGAEVSWMVTGIRRDAYANAHRIPVEQAKPADEEGTYLHPEAFGQTVEKSVERVHHGDAFKGDGLLSRQREAGQREERQK